jgi:hypothetical protein
MAVIHARASCVAGMLLGAGIIKAAGANIVIYVIALVLVLPPSLLSDLLFSRDSAT